MIEEWTSKEWTPEEWRRRCASVQEDVRIMRAMFAESRADAQMLRDRGHPVPAQMMDDATDAAERLVDDGERKLAEALEEDA